MGGRVSEKKEKEGPLGGRWLATMVPVAPATTTAGHGARRHSPPQGGGGKKIILYFSGGKSCLFAGTEEARDWGGVQLNPGGADLQEKKPVRGVAHDDREGE